jgi:hypothetical protein
MNWLGILAGVAVEVALAVYWIRSGESLHALIAAVGLAGLTAAMVLTARQSP